MSGIVPSNLLKNNLVVAAGTALSRITGLLRVVALGYVLGRSPLTDAYKLANETPNIVYELLLGGVLSATLVPLFSTFLEDDDDESTNVVITTTAVMLAALTLVAVVAAPLIFRLYSLTVADGTDADLFRAVGTTLARIFLIQILFYGITGLANAFLNSRRRFFAAAWSPIVPNLIIIATLLSLPDSGPADWSLQNALDSTRLRLTLGLGATAGIATMALLLIPAVAATGFRLRPQLDFRHPAVRKLLSLSFWTVGFVLANQVALIVVRNLTQPGSGDASSYFDAFTFFVLPHGLLAVSIATTFQPDLSRSVARRDKAAVMRTASLGIRITGLITIPAGVGVFVLRRSIVGLFFERGNYSAQDALVTSRALAGLALGLGAFSIYLFVLRAFYAHKDTRTAFTVNVIENAINIGFAFLLAGTYGVLGLGASFAIAYVIAAIFALYVLSNKLPGFPLAEVLRALAKIVVAAALMGEAVWLVTHQVGGNQGLGAVVRLALGVIAGIVVYAGVLTLAGSAELDALRARLTKRSARDAD
jgi:putative peptidoglycan lipid II flippase